MKTFAVQWSNAAGGDRPNGGQLMGSDLQPDECALLRQVLQTGGAAEHRAALRALAALGPRAEPAVPDLLRFLRHPDVALRKEAAVALARVGRPAVPALVAALRTENPDFRGAIVVTLATIGPDAADAEPALEELRADEWLGPWAAEALDRIRGRRDSEGRGWRLGVLVFLVAVPLLAGLALCFAVRAIQSAVPPAAVVAGIAMAVVGASMAPVLGYRCWHARRTVLFTLLFGVIGGLAGLMVGGLLSGLMEPVVRALQRR